MIFVFHGERTSHDRMWRRLRCTRTPKYPSDCHGETANRHAHAITGPQTPRPTSHAPMHHAYGHAHPATKHHNAIRMVPNPLEDTEPKPKLPTNPKPKPSATTPQRALQSDPHNGVTMEHIESQVSGVMVIRHYGHMDVLTAPSSVYVHATRALHTHILCIHANKRKAKGQSHTCVRSTYCRLCAFDRSSFCCYIAKPAAVLRLCCRT